MMISLIDGLWSLYERIAPVAREYGLTPDLLPGYLSWLPWVTTAVGSIHLYLIWRQTGANRAAEHERQERERREHELRMLRQECRRTAQEIRQFLADRD